MGAARGLIVEGIPGTGKTTLIREIQRMERFVARQAVSFLLFGEEMTQRTLEWKTLQGTLKPDDHFALFDELLMLLEQQQIRFHERGWKGENASQQFLYLLERFHLTHTTYYPYLEQADFTQVEERLLKVGARGCLLVMEPSVMRQRIIDSRPYPGWRAYIARYGADEKAIIEHYIRQQNAMLERAKQSRLSWLVLDTSQMNWVELAPRILAHWLNGLTA
jgi:thymidylate kinase